MANSAIASDGVESLDVPSLSNFEIKRPHRCACCRYCCFVLIALIFIAALILGLVFGLPILQRRRLPEVWTTCGLVRGDRIDGVFRFLGIPYALPPTGEFRFRRARDLYARAPCDQLSGKWPREAKEYAPPCLQTVPSTGAVIGAEDCLYLNVFSLENSPRSSPRPVIVAIGGLFFLYGNADSPGLKVTPELVRATGAVHVTFNYRLGALGFLAAKGKTNLGLWDQISALRWVKANIRNFGGDSNNVMLFGFGSGATSAVSLAMATRVATFNLFHKVWLSSPMLVIDRTPEQAMTTHKKAFGCTTPACFANKTGAELAKLMTISNGLRQSWFEFPLRLRQEPGPGIVVMDDILLSESPSKASRLRLANIPFVLGSTSNEVDVYLSPAGARLWDRLYYEIYVNSTLRLSPAQHSAFRKLYLSRAGTTEDLHTRAVTDLRVACPLNCFADTLRASAGVPRLYRYVVRGSSRYLDPYNFKFMVNSSFHGWDALLYFSDGGLDARAVGDPSAERSLRDRLRSAVAAFAESGKVPQFRLSPATNVLELKRTVAMTDYGGKRCTFWRELAKGRCFAWAWAT